MTYQKGMVDVRKQTGIAFVVNNPDVGWTILEELIKSHNPDDRDTANEVIQEIGGSRSYEIIKPLLFDEYPYLQFDACDFLKYIYPKEVFQVLLSLLEHKDVHVRNAAKKRLKDLSWIDNTSS